jgi:hypothetical protein
MRRDLRLWLIGLVAVLFGIVGVLRLARTGDLLGFAHLTMAVGLALLAARDHRSGVATRLWYVPEFVLLLAILQYGYHALGV